MCMSAHVWLRLHVCVQVVLMNDLVQRRQALEVLMSYNPFWLRLAAEVVTQKPVQMQGGDQKAHPCVCVCSRHLRNCTDVHNANPYLHWLARCHSLSRKDPACEAQLTCPLRCGVQARRPWRLPQAELLLWPPWAARPSLRRCGPSCCSTSCLTLRWRLRCMLGVVQPTMTWMSTR